MTSKTLYVIGDVHGEFEKLSELYQKIVGHRNSIHSITEKGYYNSTLCFVGDYIDRGPDSKGVLEFVRDLTQNPNKNGWNEVIPLKGNHEVLPFEDAACWVNNGGIQTWKSFGDDYNSFFNHPLSRWIQNLRTFYIQNNVAVTHAGIDNPKLTVHEHSEDDLLWSRKIRTHEHDIYKFTVHGHTPMKNPILLSCVAYIDTGAVFGGRLTCLYIPDTVNPLEEDMRIIQSSGGTI